MASANAGRYRSMTFFCRAYRESTSSRATSFPGSPFPLRCAALTCSARCAARPATPDTSAVLLSRSRGGMLHLLLRSPHVREPPPGPPVLRCQLRLRSPEPGLVEHLGLPDMDDGEHPLTV